MPAHKRTWSLYPSRHPDVSRLLEEDHLVYTFREVDTAETVMKTYDTNIKGRFVCHNRACGTNGWSSQMIAITIRLYPQQQYNARVYHQRCENCRMVSRPVLDESYAQRVAYRVKKWAGVSVDKPPYSKQSGNQPHHSSLCEGCRAGHCRAVRNVGR